MDLLSWSTLGFRAFGKIIRQSLEWAHKHGDNKSSASAFAKPNCLLWKKTATSRISLFKHWDLVHKSCMIPPAKFRMSLPKMHIFTYKTYDCLGRPFWPAINRIKVSLVPVLFEMTLWWSYCWGGCICLNMFQPPIYGEHRRLKTFIVEMLVPKQPGLKLILGIRPY